MKKRKIAIYGAGGFGREVALMLQQMNKAEAEWDIIGFYDDGKKVELCRHLSIRTVQSVE